MSISSKTYKGVRDWGVRAKRTGDKVVVAVKMGTYAHSYVDLSVATWPTNLYDQRQAATKALASAISLSADEWGGELDRIPDEIVKAMNEVAGGQP